MFRLLFFCYGGHCAAVRGLRLGKRTVAGGGDSLFRGEGGRLGAAGGRQTGRQESVREELVFQHLEAEAERQSTMNRETGTAGGGGGVPVPGWAGGEDRARAAGG